MRGARAGGVEVVVVVLFGAVCAGVGAIGGAHAAGLGGVSAVAAGGAGSGAVSCSRVTVVLIVVFVRGGISRHGVVGAADLASLLALVLDDFFEEGEAQDRFCGFGVFFFDAVGETGFCVGGREADEGFEGTRCHGGSLALASLELVVAEGGVGGYDEVGGAFGQDGFALQFGVLDVFLDKGDTEDVDFARAAAAGGHGDAGVQHDVEFFVDLGRLVGVLFFVEADAEGLVLLFAHRRSFFGAGLAVSVHSEDVLGDLSIAGVVDVVGDYKKEIETGQEGIGESDVSVGVFVGVVLAVDGIRGCYHAASRIQRCVDACFGDGDGLLFHDFVDGYSINVAHLVKLVDADDASVSQDHGTGF